MLFGGHPASTQSHSANHRHDAEGIGHLFGFEDPPDGQHSASNHRGDGGGAALKHSGGANQNQQMPFDDLFGLEQHAQSHSAQQPEHRNNALHSGHSGGGGLHCNARQRSKTTPTNSASWDQGVVGQFNAAPFAGHGPTHSASKRTPPNGAKEEDLSREDKEKMANMELSAKGRANAKKAYEEAIARRDAEEKKAEQERAEREHWKDTHEEKLNRWEFENTVRRNVRTLIGKLPDVLTPEITNNPEVKWTPIPVAKLLNESQLKRGYFKAIRVVHPDKSAQRGDSIETQVVCDYVFQALEQAYKQQFH